MKVTQKKCVYEAPQCTVAEVAPEGVLCQSGGLSVLPWEEDQDPIDGNWN